MTGCDPMQSNYRKDSQSLIDQLEQEAMVERTLDPTDRRAWRAKLTPAGIQSFEGMAEHHKGWIKDLLGGLTDEEQQLLQQLLTQLRDSLQEKVL